MSFLKKRLLQELTEEGSTATFSQNVTGANKRQRVDEDVQEEQGEEELQDMDQE